MLRSFVGSFLLVEISFVMLSLIFSLFELLSDIIRNHARLEVVGEYLLNLTPSMIYTITPLSVLIAVLVTIGTLNKSSELTAMKATGISLYRAVVPIFMIAAILSVVMFTFDQFYLPNANRKQEALRSEIKGKPPRTFLRPDREWVFGRTKPNEGARIFYYEYFDSANNRFANLTVLEFQPNSFVLAGRDFCLRCGLGSTAASVDIRRWMGTNVSGRHNLFLSKIQQRSISKHHRTARLF